MTGNMVFLLSLFQIDRPIDTDKYQWKKPWVTQYGRRAVKWVSTDPSGHWWEGRGKLVREQRFMCDAVMFVMCAHVMVRLLSYRQCYLCISQTELELDEG